MGLADQQPDKAVAARIAAAFLALVIAAIAAPLCAQVPAAYLAGTVRDSATHAPVAGAVVSMLGAGGTISARRLSNARGEYRLPGPGVDHDTVIDRLAAELRNLQKAVTPGCWLAGVGIGVSTHERPTALPFHTEPGRRPTQARLLP